VSGVKVDDAQNMESMGGLWGEFVDQVSFVTYNPWENVYNSQINEIKAPCSDLWRRMFIWFDGTANPCDTDYKSTLKVGNFQKHTISELWNSKHYQRLREEHARFKRGCVEPCKRCVVI
jgi:radical SAM protein with 4Fe4S-binding SPASM domain